MRQSLLALIGCLALSIACGGAPQPPDPAHLAEVDDWHQQREERLRRPDGWLSLAGLYWLDEGASRFGSATDNETVFPEPAPANAGTFTLTDGTVTLDVTDGVTILANGEEIEHDGLELAADASGDPTELEMGSLLFYVIERGDQVGVRLKDREHPNFAIFDGIERFPVDPAWRKEARFEPYEPPKTIVVPDVLGTATDTPSHGRVVFEHDGETFGLDALGEPDDQLWLIFGDATNGESTYGAGRFLYTEVPTGDGTVLVDFNKAYNPPCVFTSYATCPLPPAGNRLSIPVEAGEKMWGDKH